MLYLLVGVTYFSHLGYGVLVLLTLHEAMSDFRGGLYVDARDNFYGFKK